MGKQLDMFPPAPATADDLLNAAQAEMRRTAMAREASRPGVHRARKRVSAVDSPSVAYCPKCGSYVSVD